MCDVFVCDREGERERERERDRQAESLQRLSHVAAVGFLQGYVTLSLQQNMPGGDPSANCVDCEGCAISTTPHTWDCDSTNDNQW